MRRTWLKVFVLIIFAVSALTFMACYSLAFAGGWVGRYASTIELLGFVSFFAAGISGAACLYMFRDKLSGIGRPRA